MEQEYCSDRVAAEKAGEGAQAGARAVNNAKNAEVSVKTLPFASATIRLKRKASELACLLFIGSSLTLARPSLKNFCDNVEEDSVTFSWAGFQRLSMSSRLVLINGKNSTFMLLLFLLAWILIWVSTTISQS